VQSLPGVELMLGVAMPTDAAGRIGLAVGAILFVAGAGWLVTLRLRPDAFKPRLSGVGELSLPTRYVVTLALIAAGYHFVVHAVDLPQFRAPLWIAAGASIGAVLLSLVVDALERR
jgi:hypothetical protein